MKNHDCLDGHKDEANIQHLHMMHTASKRIIDREAFNTTQYTIDKN